MVSFKLVTFDRKVFCEFFHFKNVLNIYNILGQRKLRIIVSSSFWTWDSWSLVSSFAHLDMHMNGNLPIPSLSLKNTDFSKESPRAMFRRLWFSEHLRHSTLIKYYWELDAYTTKPLLEILHVAPKSIFRPSGIHKTFWKLGSFHICFLSN